MEEDARSGSRSSNCGSVNRGQRGNMIVCMASLEKTELLERMQCRRQGAIKQFLYFSGLLVLNEGHGCPPHNATSELLQLTIEEKADCNVGS